MYFLHNKIKVESNNTPYLNVIIKVQQNKIAELLFFILSYSS